MENKDYQEGQHRQTYVRNGIVRKFIGYGKQRISPFHKVLYRICLDEIEQEDIWIDPNGKAWLTVLGSERLDQNANGITHNIEVIRPTKRDKVKENVYTMKQMAANDPTVLRNGVDTNKVPYGSFSDRFKKK